MKSNGLAGTAIMLTMVLCGCGPLFGPSIPGPNAPSVTIGSEKISISWSDITGATEYILLYTTDGTEVSGSSEVAYSGSSTGVIHEDLDSSLMYRYALRVKMPEGLSDVGESSVDVQPDPVIRVNATFSGYTNSNVGYGVMRLQPDDSGTVLQYNWGGATTDATGLAQVEFDAVRGLWYGITLFLDNDNDDVLSAGDTVWGSGSGNYSYYSYDSSRPIGNSINILVSDWATYGTATTGTY